MSREWFLESTQICEEEDIEFFINSIQINEDIEQEVVTPVNNTLFNIFRSSIFTSRIFKSKIFGGRT